jgi:hypothetical protein
MYQFHFLTLWRAKCRVLGKSMQLQDRGCDNGLHDLSYQIPHGSVNSGYRIIVVLLEKTQLCCQFVRFRLPDIERVAP